MAKYRGPVFYAVRVGRKTGIFDTWEECREQVTGFSRAQFKSFPSKEQALAWIKEEDEQPMGHLSAPITVVHDRIDCSKNVYTPYKKEEEEEEEEEENSDSSSHSDISLHGISRSSEQNEPVFSQPGLLSHAPVCNWSSGSSRPMTFSQIIKQQQQQQQQSQQDEPDSSCSNNSSPRFQSPPPPLPPTPPCASQSQSQSYFSQFPGFVPNARARFDDEFSRLASSQGLVPGSRDFRRERTEALKSELVFHYSQQSPSPSPCPPSAPPFRVSIDEFCPPPSPPAPTLTPAQRLSTYQSMCAAIGLARGATIAACVRSLSGVLVNIVDFVDAKRTGTRVKVWDPSAYAAFSAYTLQPEHRFDKGAAKAHGGFLAKLLRRLDHRGARQWEERRGGKRGRSRSDDDGDTPPAVFKRARID
ncbi:Caulimovirus viroplasmin-domain-containing protein [Camillea tinctor]|nr:Caulimovirus viroplasmin-domain-containing protein [Camillea tinctor]